MTPILDTIDEVLAKDKEEREKERSQEHWHVSSLSGCLRGVYLRRKASLGLLDIGEVPLDPQKLRVFKMGDLVEEFVEKCLERSGKLLESQSEIDFPEQNLVGHSDFVILDDLGPVVVECKSVHSRAFYWQKKRGGKPAEGKIMQVSTYWRKLKDKYAKLYPDQPLRAMVLDVDKDSLGIMEYWVPLAELESYSQQALDNAKILEDCWKSETLPPPVSTFVTEFGERKINYLASYCPVHHVCLGDDNWLETAKATL